MAEKYPECGASLVPSECRRCGDETDRYSVAAQPLCWDCADHGPVAVDEQRRAARERQGGNGR